jgi:hypothetical protein
MSLFALILEALAGTVTLLSAPKLLDRVLTHLCTLPFLSSLISLHRLDENALSTDATIRSRHGIAAFACIPIKSMT